MELRDRIAVILQGRPAERIMTSGPDCAVDDLSGDDLRLSTRPLVQRAPGIARRPDAETVTWDVRAATTLPLNGVKGSANAIDESGLYVDVLPDTGCLDVRFCMCNTSITKI